MSACVVRDDFEFDATHGTHPTTVTIDWTGAGMGARDDKSDTVLSDDASTENMKLPSGAVQLTECIEKFCEVEALGEDDQWYCPRCKEHRLITKKFDLWKLPPILIVHIKRFRQTNVRHYSYYGATATTEKLNTPVDFPDVRAAAQSSAFRCSTLRSAALKPRRRLRSGAGHDAVRG